MIIIEPSSVNVVESGVGGGEYKDVSEGKIDKMRRRCGRGRFRLVRWFWRKGTGVVALAVYPD